MADFGLGLPSFLDKDEEEEQALGFSLPSVEQPLPTTLSIPLAPQADASSSTIQDPMVRDYLMKRRDQLAANKENASGPNLVAALAGLGAGLKGNDVMAAGTHVLNRQKAARDQKVTDLDTAEKQRIAGVDLDRKKVVQGREDTKYADDNDPNSKSSQLAQRAAMQLGVAPELASKITAEQFKAQGPLYEKILNHQDQVAARRDVADARKDAASERRDEKNSASQDRAVLGTQQLLESARGNPAAAQAEKDLYAADKANTLANMYGDPNKLSMPQVRLLASEIAKIATGGVPGVHELEGVTPNTLTGKLSEITGKLTNNPTPANAAAWVKQYTDYTSGLAKDAQKVIEDKYGRVIESRKNQLGESGYQMLKDNYINRFKVKGGESGGNGGGGGDAPVKMIDPKGKTRLIPARMVQAALNAGGTLVKDTEVASSEGM